MNKAIIAAALSLSVITSACSKEPEKAPVKAKNDITDACKTISSLSYTIMSKRQRGTDILEMYNAVEQGENKDFNGAVLMMVNAAYEVPAFSTAEYQEKAANEFKTKVFLECMKGAK
jgi:hypothetical protein